MSGSAGPALVNPAVRGRVYLVTGATDGIGQHTAEKLASDGATVLVHGRKQAKVEAVVGRLRKKGAQAEGFMADLSLLSEVRRLGQEVADKYPVLDGLANNAGTFSGDYTGKRVETAEGNEYSLAVNVLAPFLLTSLLLPSVMRAAQGRVLITSSISQGAADRLDDLQCKERWSEHSAYSLSKLCDAMILFELHERYANPPKLTFNTMDPGTVNTKMLLAGWGPCGIPVSSADTTYQMLTREDLDDVSGKYYVGMRPSSPMREVTDPTCRERLWKELEELTGAEYPAPSRA